MTVGLALPAPQAPANPPDLAHGAAVAANGTPDGAPACAGCHRLDGAGDETGAFPRLTGQGAFYLYKQLKDFQGGLRESSVMGSVAMAMTEAEMQDVAGYYAAARAPYFPPGFVEGRVLQRGGMLAAAGAPEKNVPACVNCHGPAGRGAPPSFPYLAGQFARYTKDQLHAWRDGSRRNDPLDVMRDIAARLDARDIEAVAEYFERARPQPRGSAGGGEAVLSGDNR